MNKEKSLRGYIKSIPVLGSAARFAKKTVSFGADMLSADRRKNALLRLKHSAFWYVLRNPKSQREFVKHRPRVSPEQQNLIKALADEGIASRSYEQAGILSEQWRRLRETMAEFGSVATDRIAKATASYSDQMDLGPLEHNRERFRRFFRDKDQAKLDDYILKMNPENTALAEDHPLLTVGLSPAVLHVVSSYLNLWPRLIYADAWYSIPMDPGKRIGSQQWHRDPEDKQMVKVYLYFSDVDEGAGAMEYILGTSNALGGRGREVVAWGAAGVNLYPSTEEVEQMFPASQRYSCSGPVGTLLFCDTTGIHRGGISKSKPRLVATWTFVTPASRHERRFSVRPVEGWALSEEARFAVSQ